MSGRVKYVRKPDVIIDDPICRTRNCVVCGKTFDTSQFIFTCRKCRSTFRIRGRYAGSKNSDRVVGQWHDVRQKNRNRS